LEDIVKKKLIVVASLLSVVFAFIYFFSIDGGVESAIAQDAQEADAIRRMERDKLISQDVVDKSLKEVARIINKIESALKKKYPSWKIRTKESTDNMGVGIRGAVYGEINWQRRKEPIWKNALLISVFLHLNKNEALVRYLRQNDQIASGWFDDISELGDEAIFVGSDFKNNSQVSVYFVKSRAIVILNIADKKRTAKQNEKEIREIAKIIEPLIVVRDSFDQ
jgi:hypothetical protein